MSFGNGTEGRPGGRFGAATPGVRSERTQISDLVAMRVPGQSARRRRVITPWRTTALIAAIVVAGGSYALGRYVIAPKPPQEVRYAVAAVGLPEGKQLSASDYRIVTVVRPSARIGALSPAAASRRLGMITTQRIPSGTFLASGMFSAAGQMPNGSNALVGLALKPGQLPAGGLAVGQKVDIYLLPVNTGTRPENLTPGSGAIIWAMLPPDSSGAQEVTVLVHSDQAPRLANYAAHGQVSLVATAPSKQG